MTESKAPKSDARRAAAEKSDKATAALVDAGEAQLAEKIARQNARFAELGAEMSAPPAGLIVKGNQGR